MTLCSAFNCNNLGVHRFPKDPKRRKFWVKALSRKNWNATDSSRLCSAHFRSEDYYGTSAYTGNEPLAKHLKSNVVPKIFCFTKNSTSSSKERHTRLENRNLRKLIFPAETDTPTTSRNISTDVTDMACEIELDSPVNSVILPQTTLFLDKGIQCKIEHGYGCINKFKNDDAGIVFYTGFETYKKFYYVYCTLSPMVDKIRYYGSSIINISTEDQFFMTMIKLRQDKCNFELSRYFEISPTTVSNIFITWINFIDQLWRKINIWPEKDLVQFYMPDSFKHYNSTVRVILDTTEIKVQKPQNPVSQQVSWSSYKHTNTLKVLVGVTPGGLFSFCSAAYAGSVSDRQIVERSGLLDLCEPGDTILADRGFNIQDMFADKNITVSIPSFLKGKSQIPGLTVLKDRKLASKRVHIERLIGLMKTYKIMKNELNHCYIPLASKIFFVCFMCCNFRENIVK